jgi:DNA-binding CsgD family transcriptional regulator
VSIGHAASDRWPEALAGFHEAVALARETGQNTELAWALARLALLEARLGRAEQSRAHADGGLDLSRRLGLGLSEVWSLAALGELELSLGHVEPALVQFQEQQAVLTAHGIRDVDLWPAPELVDLYLRLGRAHEAADAADEYWRAATAKAQPWALARAARCRALTVPADAPDGNFETALALHEQTPDVFETARTQLAYGSYLRRARKRVQAREQLRAAIGIFDMLGAGPWSEMARHELAATGETARRRNPAALDELTPQELQIALRVAAGRTTRETAAALFLSPKTIEHHLHNIYRKLAISSRRELAGAMTRPPQPGTLADSEAVSQGLWLLQCRHYELRPQPAPSPAAGPSVGRYLRGGHHRHCALVVAAHLWSLCDLIERAHPACRLCTVADQVDAFACRLSPSAGPRCGPVARCEWVAISSAACWASASQGACPPGTS